LYGLADLVVQLMGEAEVVAAAGDLLDHRGDNVLRVMAEDEGAVAEAVVEIFVAVDIPHAGPGGVVDAQFNTGTQAGVGTLAPGDTVRDALEHHARALRAAFGHRGHLIPPA